MQFFVSKCCVYEKKVVLLHRVLCVMCERELSLLTLIYWLTMYQLVVFML